MGRLTSFEKWGARSEGGSRDVSGAGLGGTGLVVGGPIPGGSGGHHTLGGRATLQGRCSSSLRNL